MAIINERLLLGVSGGGGRPILSPGTCTERLGFDFWYPRLRSAHDDAGVWVTTVSEALAGSYALRRGIPLTTYADDK
jgi:hypothetical protein